MGMEWKKAVGTLCVFACCFEAHAQERVDFKGVTLGASMKEFQEKNPLFWCEGAACVLPYANTPLYHCERLKRTLDGTDRGRPDINCLTEVAKNSTYANRPARMRATFRDGALSQVHINFASAEYSPITEALVTRYGAPASKRAEVVQNKMGATFQNETTTWNVGGDHILATRYGADLTRGYVNIMDQEELQRIKEQIEKRRKSAPGDL